MFSDAPMDTTPRSQGARSQASQASAGACKVAGKRGIILGGWAQLNIGMLDMYATSGAPMSLADKERDAELLAYCRTGAGGKPAKH